MFFPLAKFLFITLGLEKNRYEAAAIDNWFTTSDKIIGLQILMSNFLSIL
jgi:hypothetical protein